MNMSEKEGKELIRSLLNMFPGFPYIYCPNLHHEKNEYHKIGEECPVEKEFRKIMEGLEKYAFEI